MLWLAHYLFWAEAEEMSGVAKARRDSEEFLEQCIGNGWIDPWTLMAISLQQMTLQAPTALPLRLSETPLAPSCTIEPEARTSKRPDGAVQQLQ